MIVGNIRNIRKEKDMGHKTNQKFHGLPYNKLYIMLKNYLENEEGLTNRTCFVYFSNSRKKLQKTINKMKTKYQKGKTLLIREVNPNAFKFKKPEE